MFYEKYDRCTLCPRNCNVNRNKGEIGFCKMSSALKIGRASLHMWEEPCISGERGSGTVFFSGCNLKCCYCQNFNLSRGKTGVETDGENLYKIFLDLQEKGAHNINLVTSEHFAPHIKEAVLRAKENGLNIPVILNSSGYITEDTIDFLKDVIDIFLVDFKYMNSESAYKYSLASDYTQVVKTAVEKMVSLFPEPCFDENGILKKGVVVRHLCLPGNAVDSKAVIRYLHEKYGQHIILSIMSQFTPFGESKNFPELSAPISKKDYDEIIDFCLDIGIEDAYVQDGESACESFIPSFDGEGVKF